MRLLNSLEVKLDRYDREAIQEWFRLGNNTNPLTGSVLASVVLAPATALRRTIDEYLIARPELVRKEQDFLSLQIVVKTLEETSGHFWEFV